MLRFFRMPVEAAAAEPPRRIRVTSQGVCTPEGDSPRWVHTRECVQTYLVSLNNKPGAGGCPPPRGEMHHISVAAVTLEGEAMNLFWKLQIRQEKRREGIFIFDIAFKRSNTSVKPQRRVFSGIFNLPAGTRDVRTFLSFPFFFPLINNWIFLYWLCFCCDRGSD